MTSSGVVFVTVGTTRFDSLVTTVLSVDVQTALKAKGYRKILIQEGNSQIAWEDRDSLLPVSRYCFKTSLKSDIASASLVISHAGAGTCLEVQAAKKPHIVVVNEQLMDNHQLELAEKLAEGGHLIHCFCEGLREAIEKFEPEDFSPLPPGDPGSFAAYLDAVVAPLIKQKSQ